MPTNGEITLLIIGAAIALISSIVTSIVQHLLALREDKTRRERNRLEKEVEEIRQALKVESKTLEEFKAMQQIIRKAMLDYSTTATDEGFLRRTRELLDKMTANNEAEREDQTIEEIKDI